jgi:hypothetical protein
MPQVASAGNKYAFIGFLDTDGYLIGGTPTAPANGVSSSAYRVLGVKETALTIPTPDTVQATGDDALIAEFQFNSIQPRAYTVTMAVGDLTLESYLAGTNVETIAGGSFVVNDTTELPSINICLIHQQRAVSQDSATRGVTGWAGYIVPLATATYLGRDSFSERSVATYSLSVTPQKATHYPWGVSFATASGTDDGTVIDFQSSYPYHMAAFTGDGALAAWPVAYQPVSASRAGGWINRTSNPVLSVSTTTPYNVTITANAGAGVRGSILYQFQG